MNIADELLAGPRGRRLCLEYASAVDEPTGQAVFWLGHAIDPNPGTLIRFGGDPADDPTFSGADLASLISDVDLTSISQEALRDALAATVERARYWQEPDGSDAAAALPEVRQALASVAERLVAALPALTAPFAPEQWAVEWTDGGPSVSLKWSPARVLAEWGVARREDERRAMRDRPADARANFTGEWWSKPHGLLETRRHELDALQLVEDSLGWDAATLIPVRGAGRVLEIGSAADWAGLCREFPAEVTATRRHDWFRVTGRDGRWLIPDWERAAELWDAVHLTTLGYLSAATRLIEVDGEYGSVIGGWGPDSTLWLTDVVGEASGSRQQWRRAEGETSWVREVSGEVDG